MSGNMNGSKELIIQLNKILKNELTAINQYFVHGKMLSHQGYQKLADVERTESIDEMKHADSIITRILFLGGIPNVQDIGKVMVGEQPQEMLQADLDLEIKAIADLKEARDVADKEADSTTVDLIETIITEEENHYDWLRKQLDVIGSIGIQNYLQSQV